MNRRMPVVVIVLAACARSGTKPTTEGAPPAVRSSLVVNAGGLPPPAGRLENPFRGDSASVAVGGAMFVAMNCDGCHGGGAVGWVGPSLVDGRWRYGGSDGEVFHSIYYGRPRGMPAYGGILPAQATWKIVTWLRAQPVPDNVPTERWR